ncbi:hypothetical protein [Arthronema virus TR020]|uniref:Uncharacterized protein n=1 Tax=Arthronema virus TR020 TaxID=2736280 RepID=A0A7G3WH24_9CAUD|nr:hypothetical protein [Arthronema virus TR020]
MNDNEKREMGMMIPVSLLAAGLGAFLWFTSHEAHDRGEGLKLPSQPGLTYCKPQFKGDTYCKTP